MNDKPKPYELPVSPKQRRAVIKVVEGSIEQIMEDNIPNTDDAVLVAGGAYCLEILVHLVSDVLYRRYEVDGVVPSSDDVQDLKDGIGSMIDQLKVRAHSSIGRVMAAIEKESGDKS